MAYAQGPCKKAQTCEQTLVAEYSTRAKAVSCPDTSIQPRLVPFSKDETDSKPKEIHVPRSQGAAWGRGAFAASSGLPVLGELLLLGAGLCCIQGRPTVFL